MIQALKSRHNDPDERAPPAGPQDPRPLPADRDGNRRCPLAAGRQRPPVSAAIGARPWEPGLGDRRRLDPTRRPALVTFHVADACALDLVPGQQRWNGPGCRRLAPRRASTYLVDVSKRYIEATQCAAQVTLVLAGHPRVARRSAAR